METLFRQVRLAQRKLFLQQFSIALAWCWFAALLMAVVAIGVPKLWPLAFGGEAWEWGWFGGAFALGALVALVWTWFHRRDSLAAAIEIDRRCGLKERVSSSLSLDPDALESEAGRALLADAVRRVARVDVNDQFPVALGRRALLPVVPGLIALALVLFISDKRPENQAGANVPSAVADAKQIKESTESLRKKIEERQKAAKELGLKDAEDIFKKIEEGVKELSNKNEVDKKQALVKLNDLAKELEQRRQKLGGEDKIRQQLDQLKDLQKGPAEKTAQALKNGDFQKAQQELDKLKDQLKNGDLDDAKKQELAKQLEDMKDKLQKMVDAQQQAKQDLQQQIQQQRDQGNLAAADKLQQQLDKLNRQQGQNDQLQQMANNLGNAAKQLQQGNSQAAQSALNQLSQNLDQLQQQSNELKMLEGALDQLADAKDAMNCKECGGAGCKKCQGGAAGQGKPGDGQGKGNGQGDDPNAKAGDGLGAAVGGHGARPERDNPTGFFDRKIDLPIGKGAAVVTDFVDGPNVKGKVLEQIKEQVDSSKKEASDPLTGQRLDRQHREHAQQYFDALREGK